LICRVVGPRTPLLLAALLIVVGACTAAAVARDTTGRAVLYRENWDSGRLDLSQWGAQCNNLTEPNFATRGSFAVQQAHVAQGRWAARFDLPADVARPTACEVIHDRTLDLGTDDYYALALYFPKKWKDPSGVFWGLLVAQFNYEGIAGPPVGLAAHGQYVNLIVGSGYFDGLRTTWYTANGIGRGNLGRLYAIPRPLRREVWHQLIVRVRWSAGNDGKVEVFHRIQGRRSPWKETVDLSGYPTVQWSSTRAATSGMGTTDKIGAYRAQSAFPVSVFNDGFCRAQTFRAAKQCLK
jgi:hypothetical protein